MGDRVVVPCTPLSSPPELSRASVCEMCSMQLFFSCIARMVWLDCKARFDFTTKRKQVRGGLSLHVACCRAKWVASFPPKCLRKQNAVTGQDTKTKITQPQKREKERKRAKIVEPVHIRSHAHMPPRVVLNARQCTNDGPSSAIAVTHGALSKPGSPYLLTCRRVHRETSAEGWQSKSNQSIVLTRIRDFASAVRCNLPTCFVRRVILLVQFPY